jgi:hypothetical protein
VAHKNIYLEEKWDADYVFHHSEQPLLHTLILNIINNAIKYKSRRQDFYSWIYNSENKFAASDFRYGVFGIEQEHLKIFSDVSNALCP